MMTQIVRLLLTAPPRIRSPIINGTVPFLINGTVPLIVLNGTDPIYIINGTGLFIADIWNSSIYMSVEQGDIWLPLMFLNWMCRAKIEPVHNAFWDR